MTMNAMNNKLVFAGLLAGILLSCSRQEVDFRESNGDTVFYASLEQPVPTDTRVYADENLMVLWHADDRVSIFDRYTYNQEYRFTGETGDNSGAFQKVQTDDFVTGNEIPNVYAVYPYQASTRISNAQVLTLTLPSEQTYAFRSFGRGANTMVSATEDNNLLFKNVGGYLVLKLYGEGVYVTSLTLKGNADEPLAGKAVVTAPLNGAPSVEMQADASREIILTCPEPVALGASADDYTEFWFVLPPTSFADGFTVTVTGGKGDRLEKSTGNTVTINRNEMVRMAPLKVNLEPGFDTIPVGNVPDVADGSTVHVRGLVSAVASRAFVISENDGHLLVYTGPGAMNCSLGDIVTVSGTKATYRGVAEITNPDLSVSVESSGHELPDLDYQDITESFDTFSAGYAVPICFRGTLTKSGTQFHITVEGASRTGYIYWPVAGFVNEDLVGTSVLVKGFYQGRYSYTTGDFLDIVATGIETAGPPDNEIWYTTLNGEVLAPNEDDFGASIISNTYENEVGVIRFDGPVSRVGNFAFDEINRSHLLTGVQLPASVTILGTEAFGWCERLQDIVLPEHLSEIGTFAFFNCNLLTSVRIPDSVTIIGDAIFESCDNLERIEGKYSSADERCLLVNGELNSFAYAGAAEEYRLPDETCSIGNSAMRNCDYPGRIILPEGVLTIKNEAFAYSSICGVDLNRGLQTIEMYAFYACPITNVTVPETVSQIGQKAFMGCSLLESISVLCVIPPKGAKEMFDKTGSCPIYVPAQSVAAYKTAQYWSDYADRIFPMEELQPRNEIWYTSTDGQIVQPDLSIGKPALTLLSNTYENGKGVLVFEEDLETIPFGVFSFCNTLESVVFPDGVVTVKNAVFEYCENLVSVRFPSTVTQLGGYLFHDCFNLESVNIPEGVTKIDEATFAQCYKLPSVSLPGGLIEIGHSAFYNCWAFESIRIPETVTTIKDGAFGECRGLKTVTIPSGVTEIAPSLFSNCDSLTEVVIPEGVTVIGNHAFWYCRALKSTRIPSTVSSLGESAFIGSGLESVTVPGSVSEIGKECFAGCGSLSSLVLEEGLQIIGENAFEGCTSLGKVIIPPSVREIGAMAFIYCDDIPAMYLMPVRPPILGDGALFSEYNYPLFVPMEFYQDYLEAEGWEDYRERITSL